MLKLRKSIDKPTTSSNEGIYIVRGTNTSPAGVYYNLGNQVFKLATITEGYPIVTVIGLNEPINTENGVYGVKVIENGVAVPKGVLQVINKNGTDTSNCTQIFTLDDGRIFVRTVTNNTPSIWRYVTNWNTDLRGFVLDLKLKYPNHTFWILDSDSDSTYNTINAAVDSGKVVVLASLGYNSSHYQELKSKSKIYTATQSTFGYGFKGCIAIGIPNDTTSFTVKSSFLGSTFDMGITPLPASVTNLDLNGSTFSTINLPSSTTLTSINITNILSLLSLSNIVGTKQYIKTFSAYLSSLEGDLDFRSWAALEYCNVGGSTKITDVLVNGMTTLKGGNFVLPNISLRTKTLNFTGCTNLLGSATMDSGLVFQQSFWKAVDFTGCTNLLGFTCYGSSYLDTITFPYNGNLKSVFAYNCPLTAVNLNGCYKLSDLNLYGTNQTRAQKYDTIKQLITARVAHSYTSAVNIDMRMAPVATDYSNLYQENWYVDFPALGSTVTSMADLKSKLLSVYNITLI